ncbi:hypothetical protein [Paraflavitalea sp. CAU 1676]|uniref:hypothetical protein n=1 Tax=Paraflavitalea sp. CAU 1676 TaxID=3032598 RepID=UPI0023DBA2BB|nr:hypothetical protein [Paraflavitalea sp. CAU 1676]MDF2187623.1 hypothetical protein [Paraflavitalea sp. CAU 1676]
MFKPLLAVWKGPWYRKLVLIVSLLVASLYPIHRNFDHGLGFWQYQRHLDFMRGESPFFNPWQYRVLCPYVVEGGKWAYEHTVDKVVPLEKIKQFDPVKAAGSTVEQETLVNRKDAIIYLIVFAAFRFLLNVMIYLFAFSIFAYYTRNQWLNALGIFLVSLAMGNAVFNSDLSLNTYFDLMLFLWMACVVLYKASGWWIVPITILGILNRETALMIPGLYFLAAAVDPANEKKLFGIPFLRNPPRTTWIVTIVSLIAFVAIFMAIRAHYGYRPPGLAIEHNLPFGLPVLKFNLTGKYGVQAFIEIYGVLGFLPLAWFFCFRYLPVLLRAWSLILLPLWLCIHFVSTQAGESRYYLVTLILVLIPMVFEMIKRSDKKLATE